jgi:hypothetical protein
MRLTGQRHRIPEWCQLLAVAGLLIYGAAIRWSLPAVPFADPDSWGYVGPSVRVHLEGRFVQVYGRSFLYPSFVRAALDLTGSFTGLVSVQHALGLAGGLFFWAAWRESRRKLPSGGFLSDLHALAGLAALACYLLNNELIFYEHSLRPEAVFPAAACLVLWLAVRSFTLDPASGACARNAAALGAMHALLFFIHPSFGLAALGCLIPVWGRAWLGGMPRRQLALVIAALPAALVALHLAEGAAFARRDMLGEIFGPVELFAFNADVVSLEIDHDLAHPAESKYGADLLRECSRLIHANFDRTRTEGRSHPSLSYQPDAMIYSPDSVCNYLRGYFHDDPVRVNAFLIHYFARGASRHPGMYLAKIGRSLALAYGPTASLVTYACTAQINVPRELDFTQESLFGPYPQMRSYAPGAAYGTALARAPRDPQKTNAYWVQVALYAMRPFYRLLLAVSLAICMASAVFRSKHSTRGRALCSHACLTLTLFSYNFFICLTVSMISAMDNFRYSENQLAFTIFALFNAIMLLIHAVCLSLPMAKVDDVRP